jgi:hypothetical protein
MTEDNEILKAVTGEELVNIRRILWETIYSWLLIDIKQEQFKVVGEECKDVIGLLFEELANENASYHTASQCIAEILILCKKFKEKELSSFLRTNLLLLENKWKRMCEQEDIESIETYSSMFCDLADWEIDYIIENSDLKILMINLMLFNFEGKHEKAANGFFIYFLTHLHDSNKEKIPEFNEFIESLIECLLKKSIMPEEIFLELNNKVEGHSDFDEFFKRRSSFGKLYKRIAFWVGNIEFYQFLINKLKHFNSQGVDWEELHNAIELENILFGISYWMQIISSDKEIEMFQEIFSIMFEIPADKYSSIRRAVIDIIYIIAEFFKNFDIDALTRIVEYVVEGFNNKTTFDISSQCFERVILLNSEKFTDSVDKFIDYMSNFAHKLDSYRILWGKSFSTVLILTWKVYGNQIEYFSGELEKILQPFVEKLQQPNCEAHEATVWFEYLSDIFNTIEEQKKVYPLIKAEGRRIFILIWPYLFQYLTQYSDNETFFEANTRLVKKSFRAFVDSSDCLDQLAKEYLDKIVELYQARPSSWFIYPVDIWIPLFAKKEDFKEPFWSIIKILIDTTVGHLNSIEKIKSNPYIPTDLFAWMSRALKTNPKMVFTSESFDSLIEFSIICWDIEHKELFTRLCAFQGDLVFTLLDIKRNRFKIDFTEEEKSTLEEYIYEKVAIYFKKYINVILNVPIDGIIENLVDFMSNFIVDFPKQGIQFLNQALEALIPDDWLSVAEKIDFCKDFEYGEDSIHTIHKSFAILNKRCKKRMLRGVS